MCCWALRSGWRRGSSSIHGPARCSPAQKPSSMGRPSTARWSGSFSPWRCSPESSSASRPRAAFADPTNADKTASAVPSGGASGQEQAVDDVLQDGQHRLGIRAVDDGSVLGAEHGLACDRTPRVPGELYGDQAPACAEVAHRNDFLLGHAGKWSKSRANTMARKLAVRANVLARRPDRGATDAAAVPGRDRARDLAAASVAPRSGRRARTLARTASFRAIVLARD